MKKTLIIVGIIVLVIVLFYSFFKGTYNTMVTNSEQVDSQWAQVQNVYQRRSDLIPNLVSTVKGFAQQEKDVFIGVTEARAKATSVNIDAANLTPDKMTQFQQAQEGLSGALGRLMVVVEKYPEIKSNQNFLELQSQLEGTENRITVERQKFNDITKVYNTYVKSFPNNMLAGMFGFVAKPYFEATKGAEVAPKVEF
ncbi:MAG: LemA family protein [Bacteroidales bacterium]|nr:LemA family protein [Bacteroidales bacterium]